MISRPVSSHRKESVWRLVADLPSGSVSTYGDIARALRPPCNPRFVGWALRHAPPGLGLPWHRVLAADGGISVTGPAAIEQRLRLQAEGVTFRGHKVRLDLYRYQGFD